MVSKDRIDQICDGLKKRGIAYRSRMTSNGSLFSERVAEHARELWHLYEIQITLDGTERAYCDAKRYVGFKGNPYKTVLRNIGYLLKQKVHVIIRINLGLHNVSVMKNLIYEIRSLFSGDSNLTVYVGILFNNMGYEKVQYYEVELNALEKAREEFAQEIKVAGLKYGDKSELPYLKTMHCMADNPRAVLVSPTGDIGKCEHAVFDKLIGSVGLNTFNESMVKEWERIHSWSDCEGCVLYPSCVMLENCETLKPCLEVELDYRITAVRQAMVDAYQKGKIPVLTDGLM